MERITACWPDVDRQLDYVTEWSHQPARCRLRAWHDAEVAVVTELADNPGMSITNAIEAVADAVSDALDVDVSDAGYLLVEHYEAGRWRAPTFDAVRFLSGDGRRHRVPQWAPVLDALPLVREVLMHPSSRCSTP